LNPADVLTFHGIDSTVLSVTVEKGHGYLRLVNDENFIGGWLEIGQTQIVRITEDMLVTVPEGSYQVDISHNGGGGTKNVVINRNEETTLDIGDLEVAEAQYGMVLFSMNPSNAELYIDGSEADPSQPISLEYGIHQIIAKADGYKSLTQYLRVGQESAGVDVQLDKADSDSSGSTGESSSGSTSSSSTGSTSSAESTSSAGSTSSSADTTTTYYRVHIDAPENVEVYLDGNYVGISPCSFKKTSGSHVITLRKTGYETRSYTVQVDEEEKDVSYSFVDLITASRAAE
ncbi:MAG: PEGA domain-containing protein, partial [Lachnospiraceae bacterium]|nr:PEGA domain-containing protein [Lachnospiraceae bacterium]